MTQECSTVRLSDENEPLGSIKEIILYLPE
jgi:hypothetical protein